MEEDQEEQENQVAVEMHEIERIEEKNLFNTIISFVSTSFDLIRSILIRIIFAIHALAAIGLVCFVRNDLWYMVNSVGIVFIMIEWVVIAMNNGGKDLPWFSPSFCLYIATIIPPTWFLELENIRLKKLTLESLTNATQQSYKPQVSQSVNGTNGDQSYELDADLENIVPIPLLPGDIKSALAESSQNFAMYVEVSMMLIIIIGRWVMPKEGITRSELSQLLLVYMSLASDIVDLLSVLQEQKIMVSDPMVYVTLSIYSWSLFQFTLNLVVTRGRSSGSAGSLNNASNKSVNLSSSTSSSSNMTNKRRANNNTSMHNELWNVMITLAMQDFPFFILRTICVFKFNIYRIIAICTDKDYNFDPANESNNASNIGLINSMTINNNISNIIAASMGSRMTVSKEIPNISYADKLDELNKNDLESTNMICNTNDTNIINENSSKTKATSEIIRPTIYSQHDEFKVQKTKSCDY